MVPGDDKLDEAADGKSGIEENNQNLADDVTGDTHEGQSLDFISDVPLTVSVELGRTMVTLKDLLQMGQGSVIELEKLAGEPLEILVNRKEVAKGEVVVINEKYGIRLTDIVDPYSGAKS